MNINLFKDNKAESPLEIVLTIMVTLIIYIGIQFTMGAFLDGFTNQIGKVKLSLLPNFQDDMGHLMQLGSIFWVLPGFVCVLLVVWGIKSAIKKHFYTRPDGGIQYVDDY